MKKILFIFAIGLALLSANAHNYPTETVNGKLVYRYPVQKGEGLYRISVNFGVTQEDIIKWNPSIEKTGLRYGQTIYIPVVDDSKDSIEYTVHIIQSKETLYGLARQYGTTVEALIDANPIVSKNMPIGAKLLIPQTKKEVVSPKTEEPKAQETNTPKEEPKKEQVQQTEEPTVQVTETPQPQVESQPAPSTTSGEAKQASTKEEAHAILNQVMERNREIIKQMRDSMPTMVKQDSIIVTIDDEINIAITDTTIIDTTNVPVRIAFMLPFVADALKREPAIDRFVEFYEGALLAIHEHQAKGQRFEIYTYDTGKTDAKMENILSNAELKNVDFIIGPAFTSQEAIVQQFAKEYKKPIIIPFTANVIGINDNPYIFQFNTPSNMEEDTIKQYAKAHNWHIVKTSPEEIMADSTIYGKLSKEKENIIDLQTDSWIETEKALVKLVRLNQHYSIRLLSRYSWKDKTIPVPCVYTSIFSQKNLLKETAYNIAYNRFFNHDHAYETPRYDILGYDITSFMIHHHQDGVISYSGIHSYMNFVQDTAESGYINRALEIITK